MKCCNKCLFTSIDYPNIVINSNGVCDICLVNEQRILNVKQKQNIRSEEEFVQKIKNGKRGKYDCLIGISGGADSSYMVYLARKWKLNPLLAHIDGGWNTEASVINIEKIVSSSGFDFYTEVLPWNEMRDLQYAFLKAGVIDIDLPFDNALLMYNYLIARKFNIKYILNGYSTITEGIMPANFNHYKYDKANIVDIHHQFGRMKNCRDLKLISTYTYLYFDRVLGIKYLYPLDVIDYNKDEAKSTLQECYGWRDYGGKHYENIFTRFYQGYILPKKFGIDKRKSHLSILICAGQISKEDAIEILDIPPYSSQLMERDDRIFFSKKLGLDEGEFESYMNEAPRSHREFKSELDFYDSFKPIYRWLKKIFKFNTFRI